MHSKRTRGESKAELAVIAAAESYIVFVSVRPGDDDLINICVSFQTGDNVRAPPAKPGPVFETAEEFNLGQDPPACPGGHEPLGFSDRLEAAFWRSGNDRSTRG